MIGASLLVTFIVLALLSIMGRIGAGTWTTKLLLALDIWASTLIWGAFDITISARCGLYLRQHALGLGTPWAWVMLGSALNALSSGHCEAAIAHDRGRLDAAYAILGGPRR